MTRLVAKYAAFSRVAIARACRERGDLVRPRRVLRGHPRRVLEPVAGRRRSGTADSATEPRALVWYLAVTEWIVLSTPQIHLDIQETIRAGDVVYRLGRPVSYVVAELADGVRRPRGAAAAARAHGVSSARSRSPAGFRRRARSRSSLPFGLAAAALLTALHVWIGLLAFWLHDVSPVYWVCQKLLFVLGGLMLPLARLSRASCSGSPR